MAAGSKHNLVNSCVVVSAVLFVLFVWVEV